MSYLLQGAFPHQQARTIGFSPAERASELVWEVWWPPESANDDKFFTGPELA